MVHLRSRDIPPRREVLLELVEGEQRFFSRDLPSLPVDDRTP